MSGLEKRDGAKTWTGYHPSHQAVVFSIDEVVSIDLLVKSLCDKLGTTKTRPADVPEHLWRNEVFHDCGD
jgi:hypothetical protein